MLLGRCPARRWDMTRQEFVPRPTMIGNASDHGRCLGAIGVPQTRLQGAEVGDGAKQRHPVLERQGTARQRPASARQRGHACTERRVEPCDGGGMDHPVKVPVFTGSRKVSRIARMEEDQPSGQHTSARGAAPRRPRSISRRLSVLSRGSLTSPASHRRVVTIMASAIHTMAPCVLTRLASACPCPRSRGCSTRDSWTAWPGRPARAHHVATVRSSQPNATTMAWSGPPWARSVTTRVTVSAEIRRRYNAVPGEAGHV
jgi:hypothetical protein